MSSMRSIINIILVVGLTLSIFSNDVWGENLFVMRRPPPSVIRTTIASKNMALASIST